MILIAGDSTKILYKLCIIYSIILNWHPAIGNSDEYPEVPSIINGYESSETVSGKKDMPIERYHLDPGSDSGENVIADDEYPADELERIVEETTALLQSDDEQAKSKLKIAPSEYHEYVPLRNLGGSSRGAKASRVVGGDYEEDDDDDEDEDCPAIKEFHYPKHLADGFETGYWILNVKNLRQNVIQKTCVNREKSCGEEHTVPFGYKRQCKQIFMSIPLFAIPIGKKIVKENQVYEVFKFPSDCVCALRKEK